MARTTRVINGAAVRAIREPLGIQQDDLAARVGISASYLSRIETGVEKPGLNPTARKIADVLGVPLAAITTLDETEPEPVTS